MAKSSLRLRIKARLQKESRGCCASIDMSRIGNENITPSQWYQDIVFDLGLQAILSWTGGQPFLTQKLCCLAVQEGKGQHYGDTVKVWRRPR